MINLELFVDDFEVDFDFELKFEILFSWVHLKEQIYPQVLRIDIYEDLVHRVQFFDDQLVLVFELDTLL